MLSTMYKFGATIGVIFPCGGVLLVNMAYVLYYYSNDDLHPAISFQICCRGH